MSLINYLNDDNIWNEFLLYKQNSNHIPTKEIIKLEKYIKNKTYKEITNDINNYNFTTPKKILIDKLGKKKKRIVYTFNKSEMYILKLLSHLLYKYDYLFSPNLYSFRKNKSVKCAIYNFFKTKNLNNMYAYKVDISNYFNSIPINELLKNLKQDLNDNNLFNLINKILSEKNIQYKNEIIEDNNKGIMAGIPISAFLANYYLKELDEYFYKHNILYARYADDIIVFGNTEKEITEYKNIIKSHIYHKNLTINNEKEFLYKPHDEFEFLGFSFKNNEIDISNNTFKKIKGKIKRTSRGLRRWMIKKNATSEVTLKAINRKFNKKFFGKNENELSWKYWFFSVITTDKTLKLIDKYMQEEQRFIITGKHNKKNYEKVTYELLKKCNYKSLVNEYYKSKNLLKK